MNLKKMKFIIWATSHENVSSGILLHERFKPSLLSCRNLARILKLWIEQVYISYYLSSEQQRCWSDCADVRIWHKTHFCMTGPIYTLYLHRFCSLFVKFWCKSCKSAAKKSYHPACLVITFSSHHHDMSSIERYVGQSTVAFICNVAYT